METKIKRRYQDGRKIEYGIYNDLFDKFLIQSEILNSGSSNPLVTLSWDKNRMEAEIYDIETNDLPALRTKLRDIERQFNSFADKKEKEGYVRPLTWPIHLLSEKLRLEAKTDVRGRELEFLKNKLEELFLVPEKKEEERAILERGPIGVGQLRDGVLTRIDNQRVEKVNDILVITSEKSPYYGMAVTDYRQYVMAPFCKSRNDAMRGLEQKQQNEIKEKGSSQIIIRVGRRRVDPSQLPKWPEGVVNHLAESD